MKHRTEYYTQCCGPDFRVEKYYHILYIKKSLILSLHIYLCVFIFLSAFIHLLETHFLH